MLLPSSQIHAFFPPINRTNRCYLQGSQHICADKAAALGCPGKELICMFALWRAQAHTFLPESSEMATFRESRLWFCMYSSSSPSVPVLEKYSCLKKKVLKKALLAGGLLSSLPPSLSQALTFECCQVIML